MIIERYNPVKHLVVGCNPKRGMNPFDILRDGQVRGCLLGNIYLFGGYQIDQLPPDTIYTSTFDVALSDQMPWDREALKLSLANHDGWYLPDIVDVTSSLAFNLAAFKMQMPAKIICAVGEGLGNMLVIKSTGPGNDYFEIIEESVTNIGRTSGAYTIMLATRNVP